MEKKMAVLIRGFDANLHRHAKSFAALERITIRELVERALRLYLLQHGIPAEELDESKEG